MEEEKEEKEEGRKDEEEEEEKEEGSAVAKFGPLEHPTGTISMTNMIGSELA